MSLTTEDLTQIRTVVREEVDSIVTVKLKPLQENIRELKGQVEALENDIKEIYTMLSHMEKLPMPDKEFQKISIEHKLLKLNGQLLAAAREAGITLPRE
jgi:hypothetical protein